MKNYFFSFLILFTIIFISFKNISCYAETAQTKCQFMDNGQVLCLDPSNGNTKSINVPDYISKNHQKRFDETIICWGEGNIVCCKLDDGSTWCT